MRSARAWIGSAALVALVALVASGGCGGGGGGDSSDLVVSAASSLEDPFTTYAKSIDETVRQSFAGSDQLAAQIRNGARPDVYASADIRYPQALFRDGLVGKPVTFAGNRLVLAVPKDSEIKSLEDMTRDGVKIVTGDDSVPVGLYTAQFLAALPKGESSAIEANVRSREPEVSSVVGKLSQGAADAGFVYATDVLAAPGTLRAIPIAERLQPDIAYSAAVVNGTDHAAEAGSFVDGLLHGQGAAALGKAGFLPPP